VRPRDFCISALPHLSEVPWERRENEPCCLVHPAVESSNLSKLDQATRTWQLGLDTTWQDLSKTPGRAPYLAALIRTYGFVAPVESACRYTPGLERILDTRSLTRAGYLAQDLLTLGLAPADVTQLPQCAWITTFRDIPEALGWLYVLYRAAQAKRGLQAKLVRAAATLDTACAYLAAVAGDDADDRWLSFERTFERTAAGAAREITDAAHSAFAALERWNESTIFEHWRKTG
jgi:heme oxygenase